MVIDPFCTRVNFFSNLELFVNLLSCVAKISFSFRERTTIVRNTIVVHLADSGLLMVDRAEGGGERERVRKRVEEVIL